MHDILEKGVSGDGGAKNAYVTGYRIAAKTGTSEKKDAGNLGKYICSTVAYAPAENPQYAVVILVDEPTKGVLYGSTVAAPYVGNVMETILPYLGVEAVYSEEELDRLTLTVPSIAGRGWTASYAEKIYGDTFDEIIIRGDKNGIVSKQFPEADTVIEKASGTLILYTGNRADGLDEEIVEATVPNVMGMTAKAANQTLIDAGFNVRITGTKNYLTGTSVKVVSQSVPAGSLLPQGSVIEVRFLSLEDEDAGVIEKVE